MSLKFHNDFPFPLRGAEETPLGSPLPSLPPSLPGPPPPDKGQGEGRGWETP